MATAHRIQPPAPTAEYEHAQRIAQIQARQRGEKRADAVGKLEGAALGVKVLGWIIAITGFIGGAGLGLVTEDSYPDLTHPYIAVGIAVAIGSLVIGTVMVLLAHWAEAWSEMQR
jgi:hypothetical protein